MITYRELSSLEIDLGYSAKMMYSLSNSIRTHYHEASIPKGNGEYRKLYVPDEELKVLQKRIADIILARVEISPYATAYRVGGSPLKNAAPHVGHELLLKLDIRHFFDKITYALVRTYAFPSNVFSDSNSTLLATLCCYRDCLPQGAPSSPAISNIIMRDFDNVVGAWCSERNISKDTYYYWFNKVRKACLDSQALKESYNTPSIVPVPDELIKSQTSYNTNAAAGLDISIGNCVIHVNELTSPELLAMVIKVCANV